MAQSAELLLLFLPVRHTTEAFTGDALDLAFLGHFAQDLFILSLSLMWVISRATLFLYYRGSLDKL